MALVTIVMIVVTVFFVGTVLALAAGWIPGVYLGALLMAPCIVALIVLYDGQASIGEVIVTALVWGGIVVGGGYLGSLFLR